MSPEKDSRSVVQQPVAHMARLPANYKEFLEDIKTRIHSAQIKAALSANRELIMLCWDLGQSIVERQRREGWGKAVVGRLAADLQKEFPGVGGFSGGNLWRMRGFFLGYTEAAKNLAQPARELNGRKMPTILGQIPLTS